MVKAIFDKIRPYSANKSGTEQFEELINAVLHFCGSKQLRANSVRLLYLMVFSPLFLKVKVTKSQANKFRTKRTVELLVPDFSLGTFIMLAPF